MVKPMDAAADDAASDAINRPHAELLGYTYAREQMDPDTQGWSENHILVGAAHEIAEATGREAARRWPL